MNVIQIKYLAHQIQQPIPIQRTENSRFELQNWWLHLVNRTSASKWLFRLMSFYVNSIFILELNSDQIFGHQI